MLNFKHSFATIAILAIAGCSNSDMNSWSYSDKVNKISGEKSSIATAKLTDKDVPLVIVDVSIACNNSKNLIASIKTLENTEKDGKVPGVQIKGLTNKTPYAIFESRNGDSKFNILAQGGEYTNVVQFGMANFIKPEIFQNQEVISSIQVFGLGFFSQIANQNKDFWIPSAALMKTNEWYIQIPTQSGTPVIKINIGDSSLKKVFAACKWEPGKVTPVGAAPAPAPAPAEQPTSTAPQQQSNSVQPNVTKQQESDTELAAAEDAAAKAKADSFKNASPSFDCSKASHPVEKMICSDKELSSLDARVAAAYKEVRASTKEPDRIRAEQLAWNKATRQCTDKACVAKAYQQRLSELE